METREILSLVRAAREAKTEERKDKILDLLVDGLTDNDNGAKPRDVTFPLPIYFMSKKLGRRVDGQLFEDKAVKVDGKRWPSPSSNGMCDILLGYHTTMWPVWKYVAPDGKVHSINFLRKSGGPFEPKEKPGR